MSMAGHVLCSAKASDLMETDYYVTSIVIAQQQPDVWCDGKTQIAADRKGYEILQYQLLF